MLNTGTSETPFVLWASRCRLESNCHSTRKKAEVDRLSRQLADAEAELNDRVYQLFDLTRDEIKLIQREVEH